MDRYLLERGDTKVNTMASFAANGKWFADTLRAGLPGVNYISPSDDN
jgi:hypothetical protein